MSVSESVCRAGASFTIHSVGLEVDVCSTAVRHPSGGGISPPAGYSFGNLLISGETAECRASRSRHIGLLTPRRAAISLSCPTGSRNPRQGVLKSLCRRLRSHGWSIRWVTAVVSSTTSRWVPLIAAREGSVPPTVAGTISSHREPILLVDAVTRAVPGLYPMRCWPLPPSRCTTRAHLEGHGQVSVLALRSPFSPGRELAFQRSLYFSRFIVFFCATNKLSRWIRWRGWRSPPATMNRVRRGGRSAGTPPMQTTAGYGPEGMPR